MKILHYLLCAFLVTYIVGCAERFTSISYAEDVSNHPVWINGLKASISKTLQTEIFLSLTNAPDHLKPDKYFQFHLKGEGGVSEVPDPFQALHNVFQSDGWIYVLEYQADKHGGGSFGYKKENYLCKGNQ